MEEDEITKQITSLVEYNQTRVGEQEKDQTYIDDTFDVSISAPFHIVRTGTGAKIIDDVVSHIETANPQAFREPREKTKKSIESY